MNDQKLIAELVEYRRKNNYSQNELAVLLDVSRVTLHRWIEGQVQLRAANRRAILKLLEPRSAACSVVNCPFRDAHNDLTFQSLLEEWQTLEAPAKYQVLAYIAALKEQKKHK